MKNKVIKVDQLARVEGEGSLFVKITDGKVADVKLRIFEPPRFFEAFLRERDFSEAPDITARICGICPIAYQMSAVHAIEDAFGITVNGQLRELRRLIYCGEWIESHVLHIYMLHAPDFLGYEDALMLAKDKPELVQTALKLKKIGNDIVALLGGREIHPINVPRRRVLPAPLAERAADAGGPIEVGTGHGGGDRETDRHAGVPGFRAGLRIRVAAASVGIPDERGTDRQQQRAGHRRQGVRVPLRGTPRRPFERAASAMRRGRGRTMWVRWRGTI